MLNPAGPAGRCVELARTGRVKLFVSEFILEEISELHLKLPARAAITAEDTEDLVQVVRSIATVLDPVPAVYIHPIDPDDSPYIDLAIAASAELIVSRDKHLLGLVDTAKPWADEFRTRFSDIRVLTPDQFLAEQRIALEGSGGL